MTRQSERVIGIDLGGTHVRGGLVQGENLSEIRAGRINSGGSEDEVLQDLFRITDQLMEPSVRAIGVGVPSVVDVETGVIYDVVNIPSWKEVHLKELMEKQYGVPVWVNNDANCFALGEFYFGWGRGHSSMIGLTIGTGLGGGIIINHKLYPGVNCGSGEFGMVPYLDKFYEYYAAGQFFQNVHGMDGEQVFRLAEAGDLKARAMYAEMGAHLGNAMKTIMYTYDPDLIVLGGSVRAAYPFFSTAMWERIRSFVFTRSIDRLRIELSELENGGILGAAALYFDSIQ
jgi:glucokinase